MENNNLKQKNQMYDIWFFVSIMLTIYGIILTLTGIYHIFKPYTEVVLGNLNTNLWWGLIMTLSGIIFQFISRRSRKKMIE